MADLPALQAERETVSELQSWESRTLPQLSTLVASEDGLRLEHPLSSQPVWLWDRPVTLLDAAQVDGLGLLVATDQGLLAGQGLLGRAELDLEGIDRVLSAGDGAILASDELAWVWRDGALGEVPLAPPYASGPDGAFYGFDDGERVQMVRSGDSWAELERSKDAAQLLGVDGDGALWSVDGALLTRDLGDDAEVWELPADGAALELSAELPGGWLLDADGTWWRLTDAPVGQVSEIPSDARVDGMGRLLAPSAYGLEAWSVDRPLGLWGLRPEETLVGDTPLVVVPTLESGVTQASWSVDGESIGQGLELLLDPLTWLDGERHVLEVQVSWEDGAESTLTRGFTVSGTGTATWTEDVEPLYKANCATCHDNGTETILATADDWEANIDPILSAVSSGQMPLGRPPLAGAEIAILRAWMEGGFQ